MSTVARVRSDDRIYDIVKLAEPCKYLKPSDCGDSNIYPVSFLDGKKYTDCRHDDRVFTHVITPGRLAWGTSLWDAIAVAEDMIKMRRRTVKEIILF